MTLDELRATAAARHETCAQIKKMIVSRLDLPIEPAWITDDQPLFGRGLELDSIDTLELAMAVEEQYGVLITDDDTDSLLSLNRLVDHIEANR